MPSRHLNITLRSGVINWVKLSIWRSKLFSVGLKSANPNLVADYTGRETISTLYYPHTQRTKMAKQLRMDLIDEYYDLYRRRNLCRHNKDFRDNYTKISELWVGFTDEERIAINTRFIQDNLSLRWSCGIIWSNRPVSLAIWWMHRSHKSAEVGPIPTGSIDNHHHFWYDCFTCLCSSVGRARLL